MKTNFKITCINKIQKGEVEKKLMKQVGNSWKHHRL